MLGAISGAVAGLVGITPAAGFVTPMSALIIGLVSGAVCYAMVSIIKERLGYDDTLDVFGIHGAAGIFGAILTGVFATSAINPIFKDASGNALPVGYVDGNPGQIINQLIAVALTVLFAGAASFVILKFVDLTIGLRVSEIEETSGLDASQHGETAYIYAANNSARDAASIETAMPANLAATSELAFEMSE